MLIKTLMNRHIRSFFFIVLKIWQSFNTFIANLNLTKINFIRIKLIELIDIFQMLTYLSLLLQLQSSLWRIKKRKNLSLLILKYQISLIRFYVSTHLFTKNIFTFPSFIGEIYVICI